MKLSGLYRILPALLLLALVSGSPAARPGPDPIATAESAMRDGLFDVAESLCDKALKSDDLTGADREQATLLLLEALAAQHKHEAMLRVLRHGESLRDRSSDPGLFWYWKGVALQGLNRYEDLLEHTRAFRHEREGDPHFAIMRHLEAIAMERMGRLTDALTVYEQTATLEQPETDRALLLLDWGQALVAAGQTDKAREILTAITALSPELPPIPEAYLRLAYIEMRQTNWARAIGHLTAVTNLASSGFDTKARALAALAESDESLNGTNRTLALLEQACDTAVTPDLRRTLLLQLGLTQVRLGQLESGMSLVQRTLAEKPSAPAARAAQLALADLLYARSLFSAALTEYQRFLDTYEDGSDDVARAHAGRGRALTCLGRYAESARAFHRAARLVANRDIAAEYNFLEADAHFSAGQISQATTTYEQIRLRFPSNELATRAAYQLAECRLRSSGATAAIAAFDQLASTVPDSPFAERALLRIGEIHGERNEWQEALAAYNTILTHYPQGARLADAMLGRGIAAYRMAMYDDAMADFESIAQNHPGTAAAERAFYLRGICQYWTGDADAAIATCQTFLERYPESIWTEEALFWLAEHEYNRGAYAVAESNFLAFTATHPHSDMADDACLYAGLSAARQREYIRSVNILAKIPANFPGSPMLPRARLAQADAMMELADFATAILLYDEVIRDAPDGGLAATALAHKGDAIFALGPRDAKRYDEAITVYQKLAEHPAASHEVTYHADYMMARCLEAMNRLPEAIEGYYVNVILRLLAERDRGTPIDEASTVWFAKSVFRAADLMQREGRHESAMDVLHHLAASGLPGATEAAERIRSLATSKNAPAGAGK